MVTPWDGSLETSYVGEVGIHTGIWLMVRLVPMHFQGRHVHQPIALMALGHIMPHSPRVPLWHRRFGRSEPFVYLLSLVEGEFMELNPSGRRLVMIVTAFFVAHVLN